MVLSSSAQRQELLEREDGAQPFPKADCTVLEACGSFSSPANKRTQEMGANSAELLPDQGVLLFLQGLALSHLKVKTLWKKSVKSTSMRSTTKW